MRDQPKKKSQLSFVRVTLENAGFMTIQRLRTLGAIAKTQPKTLVNILVNILANTLANTLAIDAIFAPLPQVIEPVNPESASS